MKKIFEIPTIEKVNFVISDDTLCVNVTSGVTTDLGIITEMTDAQLGGQTSSM